MIVSVEEFKSNVHELDDDEWQLMEDRLKQGQAAAEDFCRVKFEDCDAPEPVRLAIILFASYFYEDRDASNPTAYENMMKAFHALLYPYRDEAKLF